jgi:pimeloyl-ACP methyl ester carboxylesterase
VNGLKSKISFRLEPGHERTIQADWYKPEGPSQGTVIVIHGYKGFKDYGMFPRIGQALSATRDVIVFNFSHNGIGGNLLEFTELELFARNTYSVEQEDLLALVKAVREGALPVEDGSQPEAEKIFLLGHSKGGGAALLFALDHPQLISGAISWNGIADLDLFSEEEKTLMRSEGRAYTVNARTKQNMPLDCIILEDMELHKERFNLIGRISGLRVPAVLIQGERDSDRLIRGSARLTEAQPNIGWHLVPEGDHRFNTVHPYAGDSDAFLEAIRLTQLWLDDQG